MTAPPAPDDLERAWDARVGLLTRRLSPRMQGLVERVQDPRRWIARRSLGLLFILGTLTSVPRNKGLWLLPIGITLLCGGVSGWKAPAERYTRRIDPTLNRLNPWWRER
ncbi:hypothetical protein [Methylobacterium sp. J-090]|uniref:hypothetical protein n=1 Tax=Methylobacterium sp. J-090 TaxID=2836666 RepID=UPI001FB99D26|nr:hypothetical protein [Methylobacterium sp. J-090]MCJ2081196.1 hypothetical protein [Methylobacterium sp. J-090]